MSFVYELSRITSKIISRFLDDVGDGSGTKNANGDFSVTPKKFLIKPALAEIFVICRLLVFANGTGSTQSNKYGTLAALTNGYDILLTDDSGTLINLTDGIKIKSCKELAMHSFESTATAFAAGPNYMSSLLEFERDVGVTEQRAGIRLIGKLGHKLEITLNDDLTGLDDHFFRVGGTIEGVELGD